METTKTFYNYMLEALPGSPTNWNWGYIGRGVLTIGLVLITLFALVACVVVVEAAGDKKSQIRWFHVPVVWVLAYLWYMVAYALGRMYLIN